MEFQNQILQSFLWHFTEQKFSNIGNFRFAVKDYNEKITDKKFSENLDKPILETNKVAIQYEYWDQSIEDIILIKNNEQKRYIKFTGKLS